MTIDERSDQFWGPTHTGGMSTSQQFAVAPTAVPPINQLNQGLVTLLAPAGQGVVKAGDGMIVCGGEGSNCSLKLLLKPFGTGDPTTTFNMNVYHWTGTNGTFLAGAQNQYGLWIPTLMASYAVTLGTTSGAQGSDLGPGFLFPSAITQTFGPAFWNNLPPQIIDEFVLPNLICVRTLGARFVQVAFTLGTATSANCLFLKV